MRKSILFALPVLPALFLFALFAPMGVQPAHASQYYYFKAPANNATYKVGDEVAVSFYAGAVISTTSFDAWGRPSSVTYEDMPVTFKVMKGSTELYSQDFTYQRGTTFDVTYKPQATGTLTLQIYGRSMGLGVYDQTLQDTVSIVVKKKKATAVKKIKPKITVERVAKNAAEIACENSEGFGMKVYRATKKKGKYKLVKTTSKSTYTNKKLSAKKVYYYKVRLYAKSGKKTYLSKWSAVKKAGKFKGLITLSYSSTKGVKVSWAKAAGAGYYLVGRNNSGTKGEYDIISCESNTTTTYYDKDVVKGKTYYYCILAEKDGNDEKPIAKYMSDAYKIKVS